MRHRQWLVLGVLTAVALTSACGGGPATPHIASAGGSASASAGAAAGPAPATDPHERALQFARCLRSNGLQVADPQPSSGVTIESKDKTKANAALQACARYNPKVNAGPPSPTDLAKLRAFAACIRAHGVPDFPDPDPHTGGFNVNKRDAAKFNAARQACRSTTGAGR